MVTELDTNDAETRRKGLSKSESFLLSSLSEMDKRIFGLSDLTEYSVSYKNAKVIVNRLVKKGWLIPLKRGKYLIVPLEAGAKSEFTEHEFIIASHLAEKYYIGYWSALNYHGLTEQVPFTVYVVTRNRLKDRTILNTKFRVVTIHRRKFFGFDEELISNKKVNISDKEKTLADCLDHPEYSGGVGEIAKSLWHSWDGISSNKLVDYSSKMGNSAILKRLGFLVELLELEVSDDLMYRIRDNLRKGYVLLDPPIGERGPYSTKWGLRVNVSENSILEWRRGF